MPRILTSFLQAEGIAKQALAAGEFVPGPIGGRWDIAGNCLDPVWIETAGLGQVKDGSLINLRARRMYVDLVVRCRKCTVCLRYRAWNWRTRARTELEHAARTWFGTLTLRPEAHYLMECVARNRLSNFDGASPEQQFAARHVAASVELTKWLKRVRKNSGADLRYCLVAERHKSGLPHYHVLIHEVNAERPVSWRQLSESWRLGFSQFKLVADDKAAGYVTKYLSKDASARVRASIRYGELPESSPINALKGIDQKKF